VNASGLPTVAVVGRPNVGKSTLFNRILGRRAAIVEERPGVTRDRKELEAEWLGHRFAVVDSGGWVPGGSDLDAKVSQQAEQAMRDADLVLLVVDGTSGIADEDARVAEVLHRLDQPVLLVVNKIDSAKRDNDIWEFVSLGFGEPLAVSALHGRNSGDLLDRVVALLPLPVEPTVIPHAAPVESVPLADTGGADASRSNVSASPEEGPAAVAVALVGRPNVGKSTLFNRIIGEDRSIVHDLPGTTRDSVDTVVETPGGPIRFVDTAGMRRRSRVDEGAEYYSVVRALQSVDDADVALLLIDATEGVTHQDQRLAERVDAAGCPVVVLLNKWDAVDADAKDDVVWEVGQKLRFLGEAPVLRISALTGRGTHRVLDAIGAAVDAYRRRVPTRQVNDVVQAAQAAQPAPAGARILYATQGATDPPTFTLFTNRDLPKPYVRYIERRLREEFDLQATAVKMRVRRRS
jgi:GTPase